MHDFRVWAPAARTMAVEIAGAAHAMQRCERGWWSAKVTDAGPGTEYKFRVDGGEPLPDPRSPYQPAGIDGPSRLIDHSGFRWSDQRWQARPLASGIIYELHVGTFTRAGTFRAAVERLDYLVDLGVTHVELMPVNEFSGEWGWGYDGVDLFAPHHAYGTPDDLKTLVDVCHGKGLAVLLDVVYNHLGPAGNYLDRFGPYFTDAYQTPWGAAVNLDQEGSEGARQFFLDNALMWLRDYHFDGLRLDAIHAYYDQSAVPFLETLAREVAMLSAHLGRHLVLIAESDLNDPRVVKSLDAGGYGMDAQWSDDFHHALHAAVTGETKGYYEDFGRLRDLAVALQEAFVYAGVYSGHRGRVHGRPAQGVSGHRFLAYSQNHDQIGNRANGDRLSHITSAGRNKIAAALVLTSPFVPMLFQGEEFCASAPFQYFTQHRDTDLGKSVSAGRRSEFAAFGWGPEDVPDPQDRATFERSKLPWDEVSRDPHKSMLDWYRKLMALRKRIPALTDGRLEEVEVVFDEESKWLVVRRGPVEVVCNLAKERQAIAIDSAVGEVICSESDWKISSQGIDLPAESVAISIRA